MGDAPRRYVADSAGSSSFAALSKLLRSHGLVQNREASGHGPVGLVDGNVHDERGYVCFRERAKIPNRLHARRVIAQTISRYDQIRRPQVYAQLYDAFVAESALSTGDPLNNALNGEPALIVVVDYDHKQASSPRFGLL